MAHKQVAEAVRAYGDRAVLDGYMELKADHADGKVRALNVKAFYGFVRTARERQNRFAPKKPKLSRWAT
jgi:ketosteroid isomerase-like protein